MEAQDRLIVGLTGGIGSGKSTVAALFAGHGAGIIDTDTIAHTLTQAGGDAIEAIRTTFGADFITHDGILDRVQMRALIFSNPSAKLQLEQILHPLIFEQARVQLQQLPDKPYTLIAVPLLAESHRFRQLVQRVLVVDCDEHIRIERVVKRSRMTELEVRAIISRQTTRIELLRLADDVIHNDGDMANLDMQVATLHESYAKMQNSN